WRVMETIYQPYRLGGQRLGLGCIFIDVTGPLGVLLRLFMLLAVPDSLKRFPPSRERRKFSCIRISLFLNIRGLLLLIGKIPKRLGGGFEIVVSGKHRSGHWILWCCFGSNNLRRNLPSINIRVR